MLEVAEIFRRRGDHYRRSHVLLPRHRNAMAAIEACRTPVLGGQAFLCDGCSQTVYAYHSCKSRHCPKCHGTQTRRWLDLQRERILLDCPFHHLVFTLPEELRPLARERPKFLYGLLMKAAAAAVQALARDPRFLGATPGILAVLHTWTRALVFHPHVHLLVTAGGIDRDGQWVPATNTRFLFPVRALSTIFRAKVRDAVAKAGCAASVPTEVWASPWVVHSKPAGRGERVLDYLARYVHRVAIANSAILRIGPDTVTFRYRDNRSGKRRAVTLSDDELIRRFLLHVLPDGFIKVRYYGLFSASSRPRLDVVRATLALERETRETCAEGAATDLAASRPRCPLCKVGRLVFCREVPRPRARSP